MPKSKVAVLKTSPETILEDYKKLMLAVDYESFVPKNTDTLIKLNLSWTKYFPSCSSQPWQLEGVIKALLQDGYKKEKLFPVENKTVVTNPVKGAKNNKWTPILQKYGLSYFPLPDVEWIKYEFKSKLLKLDQIFPEGIEIPKMFIGKNVIHLPTVKTHGHSTTTGAIKNAFGGLLKVVRHYAHKYIHEVLVDLLIMQKELHPGIFCVMDGTVCGDGAGPRTMKPKVKNFILASSDSVAIDSVSAKIMGFEPLDIPYIRMCHERGLGVGDPGEIEVVGEDIAEVNFQFKAKRSIVIWGDQMLRKGFLRPLEKLLLHTPLIVWAPFASNIYHDLLWYSIVGRKRIKEFLKTEWGELWQRY
ncbi:iron-sulfur cluster-binding protein [candidate division WOR-1 bacterium DG_54_3]|uniref:Iron-sulfur cluster-binding protein n=1 Tax=candidate division WOR-1 bacterium DG_54_3 TaxID=1703775 RepID=A0A0S7Y5D3_UNCSA|nr:MAG: iron-sulfur cluster-binding protein [candidate division WOR-1 bacterium DG_54_3]